MSSVVTTNFKAWNVPRLRQYLQRHGRSAEGLKRSLLGRAATTELGLWTRQSEQRAADLLDCTNDHLKRFVIQNDIDTAARTKAELVAAILNHEYGYLLPQHT